MLGTTSFRVDIIVIPFSPGHQPDLLTGLMIRVTYPVTCCTARIVASIRWVPHADGTHCTDADRTVRRARKHCRAHDIRTHLSRVGRRRCRFSSLKILTARLREPGEQDDPVGRGIFAKGAVLFGMMRADELIRLFV
ncbi:hypothetical protein GWI33_011345 [Rhynchophorus ferrugineus]|uniref:Uncharacterized protein n=1 Tax=Rhynchophorus ferrugineus TaxID=354439 RepID=A0A834M8G6_RHYFE|nr:hypothetical protein GWI33_011345 [Rhynchophorus ferrugineus]